MTGVSLYVSLNIYHQTMKAKAGPVISSKKSWPSLGRQLGPGNGTLVEGTPSQASSVVHSQLSNLGKTFSLASFPT